MGMMGFLSENSIRHLADGRFTHVRHGRPRHGKLNFLVPCIVGLLVLSRNDYLTAYSRYPSYYGYEDHNGGSGGVLLPPVVWVFQDWQLVRLACPTLLGFCVAAVVGFILQHCFQRLWSFQRLTVFYPPTLKAFEVWRLWTHTLLHSDLGHLAVNLLHVLNTLDLEGVVLGSGYPGSYTLGSLHTGRAAATAAAYGALVGSLSSFGAMFEGASAMCFGLDGALFAVCGLLLGANVDPSLRSFLEVRGLYVAIHMGIDILRGCSSPYGTIGNVSHLAGFVGGFCYILVMLPEIGGRPVPTVPCLRRGHSGWNEDRCLAFFSREYSASVDEVQTYAMGVLGAGIVLAVLNAFVCQRQAHASADGYSIFVKAQDSAFEQAVSRSRETFAAEQRSRRG